MVIYNFTSPLPFFSAEIDFWRQKQSLYWITYIVVGTYNRCLDETDKYMNVIYAT